MKSINQYIELKSQNLAENPFCKWLTEGSKNLSSYQDVFCFSPNMLYFILGFKDILSHLEYQNPKTEIEKYINLHCFEDKNHWMWYLQDLKTLGYSESIQNWSEFIKNIWNDENKPTRDLVYLSIYYIKKFNNPIASLTLIECMESAFGVFMNCLNKRLDKSELYKNLHYFGETHHIQETNHTLGHWIEDTNSPLSITNHHEIIDEIQVESIQKAQMLNMVDEIFQQFDLVFNTWLQNKETFLTKHSLPEVKSTELSNFN